MYKKLPIILFLIVGIVFISGCASISKDIARSRMKLQRYKINYAKSDDFGILMLHCEPLDQAISGYVLKIDDNSPQELVIYSITEIKLDPGIHSIELFSRPALLKGLYGESFGKKTHEQIEIITGERVAYKFTGPFTTFSKGTFEKIEYK